VKIHYIFGKSSIPTELKDDFNAEVVKLSKLNTKQQVLEQAYNAITTRYSGNRAKTIFRIFDIFAESAHDLWNRTGFMHCTNQNYLLSLLLINSGQFKVDDIKPEWTMYWCITPHQYLRVRLKKNQYVNVDAWSAKYGIKLGDYARWFHTGSNSGA
jgi:hypothetical protein